MARRAGVAGKARRGELVWSVRQRARRAQLARITRYASRASSALPTADVEILVVALFLLRLVNVFEGLEGEGGGADFVGLAALNEFDFTFVGEEEEAVFLRERLALLDELDEVALFGVGEVVSFGVVLTCHTRCSLLHALVNAAMT